MTGKPQPKIVSLPSMGGSGKTASLVPGAGEDFDKNLAAYKERMKAHTAAIKKHLTGSSTGHYRRPVSTPRLRAKWWGTIPR
ncbi:MAG: hypothetical protein WA417_08065 [Stellaceae bacterium]|jgi:hypothetical protein